MDSQLSGPHQKIYQRVFQHPMPHNLPWREVDEHHLTDAQLLAKARELFVAAVP